MMYAVGATYTATDNLKLDAAISYINFDKSNINRTDVTATGSTVNLRGTAEGSAVVLSTGARFSF